MSSSATLDRRSLFEPTKIGSISVSNRVAMAPLTRNRAGAGGSATDTMVDYYRQRAGAGLIVSEASQIRPDGQGYIDTPGIHTTGQIEAWKKVTGAVHEAGGAIVIQLWHVGRISHVSLLPDGVVPVSSTDRAAVAKTFTADGFVKTSTPRALTAAELPRLVDDYRKAAGNALRAGFDGVEVHGANGYLLEQFLRDSINDRGDAYGGPIENRCRLPVEVMAAIAEEIGPSRTGLRLSPVTSINGAAQDSDAQALFNFLVERLASLKIAFLHLVEGQTGGSRDEVRFDYEELRARFKSGNPAGAWIANNGYKRATANEAVASGRADMVAFGRPFIANPDLVARLEGDAPLALFDVDRLYGGGPDGYTDYAPLDRIPGAVS
jgi:N-ethylmaleimide reductase